MGENAAIENDFLKFLEFSNNNMNCLKSMFIKNGLTLRQIIVNSTNNTNNNTNHAQLCAG